jgi:arylsulfatase A-like enzyme
MRLAIIAVLGVKFFAGTCSPAAAGEATPKGPNILLAIADDWAWPHAGVAGDQVVRTPAFDRLARDGVLFTQAFVSAPSCSPSRAAILTGQHFWRLEEGAILWSTLPAKFPVYPDLLEKAGYHVGHTGKGWGPGPIAPGGRPRNPAGPLYKSFQQFLDARPKGAPFCFWFGSFRPHRHYQWQSGIQGGLKTEQIAVPPCLPDTLDVRTDLCDYYWNVEQFDREVANLIDVLRGTGEQDNTLVVVTSDNGMPFPRCKSNLYDLGTRVPLLVCWPGRLAGNRRVDDLVSLIDLAPTFLEAAGVRQSPGMNGKGLLALLLSGKNGRVEAERDCVFTGKERHAFLGYPTRAVRTQEHLYIRNFAPDRYAGGDPSGDDPREPPLVTRNGYDNPFGDIDGSPTKYFMLKHREESAVKPLFDLAFARRPAEELYDLRNDPDQLRNVATDSRHVAAKTRLAEALMSELRATKDPRVLGAGGSFDRYPYYYGPNAPRPEPAKPPRK